MPSFSIDPVAYGKAIQAIAQPQSFGAVAVFQNDALAYSDGWGVARLLPVNKWNPPKGSHLNPPLDPRTTLPMTPYSPMSMGSMGKTLTAAAVLKVAHLQLGSSASYQDIVNWLQKPMSTCLPSSWGSNSKNNTIKLIDLLQQNSGLLCVGLTPNVNAAGSTTPVLGGVPQTRSDPAKPNDPDGDLYANLKQTWRFGRSPDPRYSSCFYNNANFSMFRVALPYILEGQSSWDGAFTTDASRELATAAFYLDFVKAYILDPVGAKGDVCPLQLPPDDLHPYLPFDTQFFNFYDPTNAPYTNAWGADCDGELRAGAGWWILSAYDMGQVLLGMQNGKIFPTQYWEVMTSQYLGLDGYCPCSSVPSATNPCANESWTQVQLPLVRNEWFPVYWKNGGWSLFTIAGNLVGLNTVWVYTEDGTTALLFMNSALQGNNTPEAMVFSALAQVAVGSSWISPLG